MTMEIIKGKSAGKMVPQPAPPKPGEKTQTPAEIEGPYFRLGAPERSNLLEPGDNPEIVLRCRVMNEKGTPIPHAIVYLWSSDAAGNYDLLTHRYCGYQYTDTDGWCEFISIIPGCYFPRDAKHFHVKIQGNSSPTTTQLYVEGEPGNEEDEYYSSDLLVHCTTDDKGVKHGSIDFFIKQVTDKENVTPECLAAVV